MNSDYGYPDFKISEYPDSANTNLNHFQRTCDGNVSTIVKRENDGSSVM